MRRAVKESLTLRARLKFPSNSHSGAVPGLLRQPVASHSISSTLQKSSIRVFSSSEATATASATASTSKQSKKNDSNIFLDNLGTIFLTAIAAVVGTLIRSSYNTSNRNKVRDAIEDVSAIDPVEIDELRVANSELQPPIFQTISKELTVSFPEQSCSYHEFIRCTRRVMAQLKGDAFTIQLGHLIDRVVAKYLDKYNKTADDPLPLTLWLTTLSLTLHSSPDERIAVLFEVLETQHTSITLPQVQEIVGYLQDTCQLPADTQVVPTEVRFPTQQWERGTPEQLVPWEGSSDDTFDLDAFASVLRSKSVCAWGECYHKKKA